MTISNLAKVISQLKNYGRGFVDGAIQAQVKEGQRVLDRSQQLVPVDRGWLKATGRLHAEVRELRSASVEIRYGSDRVDYAVIVHEDLEAHHPVGQARYLSAAVDEISPGMGLRIGQGAVAAAKRRSGAR